MEVSSGIFIQVYDENKKNWITVCPITSILNDTDSESSSNESAVLYTLAHQEALVDYFKEK